MEQDFRVYEFLLGDEAYIFEAHSLREAEKHREYALSYFEERLGSRVRELNLAGPFQADGPRAMREGRWVAEAS